MTQSELQRKAGRPRSQAAREAVLAAAYRIVMGEGVGRLTIERVAQEAGVGKPTIYRSWANAHELAMAAFMAQPQDEFKASGGSAKHRLKTHLRSVVSTFSTPRGRQVTLTMAASEQETELSKAFRNQVILRSRDIGREMIEQAIEAGEVQPDVDIETVLDMLYGPIFFRLLAGHQSLTKALATNLVETLFAGIDRTKET